MPITKKKALPDGMTPEDFLMTVIQTMIDELDKTANAPPGKSELGVWGVMKRAQRKLADAGYEVVIHGEN